MQHDGNPVPAAPPWRLLLLDRDPDDPKWIMAVVTLPADVRPAALDKYGRYLDWEHVTAWVRESLGHEVQLSPIAANAWQVREPRS